MSIDFSNPNLPQELIVPIKKGKKILAKALSSKGSEAARLNKFRCLASFFGLGSVLLTGKPWASGS